MKMSKQMGLVDSRGPQGVFSRGKPVYRGGSNSPKAGPGDMKYMPINRTKQSDPRKVLQRAAKKRLKK